MAKRRRNSFSTYLFSIILIFSIFLGGITGYLLGPKAMILKPLGDIFLNLLFTIIVPLVFFSVASAISKSSSLGKLGRILGYMFGVFLFTGIIASLYMLTMIKLFPLNQEINLTAIQESNIVAADLSTQIVSTFTAPDFSAMLSQNHILALIIFSMLVGIATLGAGEKGKVFSKWLQSGEAIFMRLFDIIMYLAPIGFFSYFAILVIDLGPKFLQGYVQVATLYFLATILYFIVGFSFYAYLAGKVEGIKLFWRNVPLPATTAIATCSSIASIPANLEAARDMKIPPDIYETTIPLGAIIHKDGSVMAGVLKIALLFSLFHMSFSGIPVLLTALVVSLLVGIVMGAIPSGGMLGELLILSVYGFPPNMIFVIAAISIIGDAPATLLNVTGDGVASMLVTRLVNGKNWIKASS